MTRLLLPVSLTPVVRGRQVRLVPFQWETTLTPRDSRALLKAIRRFRERSRG